MIPALLEPIWGKAGESTVKELVGQIEVHVCGRLAGRLRDFRVLTADHGLILQGHVQTYHAKQLAQHAVMEATNIPILANDIEVDSCKRRTTRDAVLHLQRR